MITDTNIVNYARACIGTPWLFGGRVIGKELDCVGLITVGVLNQVGFNFDYRTTVRTYMNRTLELELNANLIKVEREPLPGDIGLFWIGRRSYNQHCAVYTPSGLVHTYVAAGKVVEEPISERFSRSLVTVFEVPNITRELSSHIEVR